MDIVDNGPEPNAFDIEQATVENTAYRTVAWTGRYLQVTLMSIPVGESIGLEAHPETDQFLRLDAGRGRCVMGPAKDDLPFEQEVSDGWSIQVPAGTAATATTRSPCHPRRVPSTAVATAATSASQPARWLAGRRNSASV